MLTLIFNILPYRVNAKPMYIDARSAIAVDSESKCVLYEKNSELLIPIASTTKIMTTLVAIKYGDLNKKVEISSKSSNIHGSQVGYKKGELISIRELLYGLMLRSGNDAAIAIAEGISGSVEEFLKLMNEYAQEIGAINTHFESPHGLDSQYHYSTAYDLALITAKAKENKLFNHIVGVKDVDAKEYGFTRSYHNINKILYQIPGANGVKTGYTGNAGKCLVTSVNMGGRDIVIVVLNCSKRWGETRKIYEYVKGNYEFKKVIKKGEIVDSLEIDENKKVNLICDEDIIIPIKKEQSYETKVIKPVKIQVPIQKGENLGKVCIYKNGTILLSKSLKSSEKIDESKKLKILFKNLFK
nr:D-alanyl-D-alanine carboxypeptidase family protein [Clostridium aestuarii]